MPTVFWSGKARFVIRTREEHHTPHVHVILGRKEASIAIETLKVLANTGFNMKDLNGFADEIWAHREDLMAMWREIHE